MYLSISNIVYSHIISVSVFHVEAVWTWANYSIFYQIWRSPCAIRLMRLDWKLAKLWRRKNLFTHFHKKFLAQFPKGWANFVPSVLSTPPPPPHHHHHHLHLHLHHSQSVNSQHDPNDSRTVAHHLVYPGRVMLLRCLRRHGSWTNMDIWVPGHVFVGINGK